MRGVWTRENPHLDGFFILAGGLISWSFKRQPPVLMSTSEAEYGAAADATMESIWIMNFTNDLDVLSRSILLPLYVDNASAIKLN